MSVRLNSYFLIHLLLMVSLFISPIHAATDLSLSSTPLFLNSIPPNVMVMLDNSGSMKVKMYSAGYDNSIDYHGIFEADKNYIYDLSIPVNTGAYIVQVNALETGAFVESSCTPSVSDTTCWSGRYLNWLTTKRIDSSRMVLVGGKLESTSAYNYGTNLNYKIVANNEHADRLFSVSSSDSGNYSPVPNNSVVKVDSPARLNSGNPQNLYSPYAKITTSGSGFSDGKIYNSAGLEIGEFGSVEVEPSVDSSGNLKESSWVTVNLQGTYSSNPAVVAGPLTFNGGDPGVIRIKNLDGNGFQINMQEWDYRDGNHTNETINYLVLKQGHHYLDNGIEIDADTIETDKENASYTSGNPGQSEDVYFNNTLSTPVVISTIVSFNDSTAVAPRVWDVDSTGFKVAMQEQETLGGHGTEKISYVAIEQGSVSDTTNIPNWSLKSATANNVTHSKKTITFASGFANVPFVIAGIQTNNGADPSTLRLRSTTTTNMELHIEEEKSNDTEIGHAAETIGYIALTGAVSSFNVALAVDKKPSGLLQDIGSKVRLGVSFYKYSPSVNDIYNGNTIQGGTLKFKIPLNPFVKKPTNTSLPIAEQGYREINGYIGSSIDDVSDAIQNVPLIWGTTPLAENLWEVIQYFEQDDPHYADVEAGFKDFDKGIGTIRDPYYYPSHNSKLECAKSSVIIFTDGEPYRDADIPSEIVDYDEDSSGHDYASTDSGAQGKDNLDDVAYWGYCDKSTGACDASTGGSRDLRSDIDDIVDEQGNIIPQFLKVYTVGFANGNISNILQDTADNGGGVAYAAQDGASLKNALEQAFTAAIDESSASSVAVTTGSINAKAAVFQPRFNSNNWTGDIGAFPVKNDGSLGTEVRAYDIPTPAFRNVITYNGIQGIPFQWPAIPSTPTGSELSIDQQLLLNDDADLLEYLRGESSLEEKNGGSFRDRSVLLGDIIHSSPVFVASTIEDLYPDDWGSGAPENSSAFSSFKSSIQALNSGAGRTPMIYVGANDGMLHAFNALINEDSNGDGVPEFPSTFGDEQFAYVPNVIFHKLSELSNPNFAHLYNVDGSPNVGTAFFNNAWHSVLVSGVRGGGQGIFALDVTNPADYSSETNAAAKVLWEFSDHDDDGDDSDGNIGEKGDNDLGYTFSRPNIVRMQNGVWAAVFGNGYNNIESDVSPSANGNAVLYIVNIANGELIKKIDTGVGFSDAASGNKPNGLATVAPVDLDGDLIIDYIYGGDLFGNLWKFDVSSGNTSQWSIAYSGSPLFTACSGTCTNTNRQPITVRPQVGKKKGADGYMVYFGTGKYFETTDNSQINQLTHSFYGIWDKHESTLTSFDRSDLLEQEILKEVSQGFDTDQDASTGAINPITGSPDANGHDSFYDLRITTENTLSSSDLGWYIDLINKDSTANPSLNNYGERQVSDPILRNGRVIFTTLIPSDDPCENGGTGWLMELNAQDGSRLDYAPFDLNDDGVFDYGDHVDVDLDGNGQSEKINVSGKKSKVGIILSPTIIDDGDKEYKYNNGSSGDIGITRENPGQDYSGRQSWIFLEND